MIHRNQKDRTGQVSSLSSQGPTGAGYAPWGWTVSGGEDSRKTSEEQTLGTSGDVHHGAVLILTLNRQAATDRLTTRCHHRATEVVSET